MFRSNFVGMVGDQFCLPAETTAFASGGDELEDFRVGEIEIESLGLRRSTPSQPLSAGETAREVRSVLEQSQLGRTGLSVSRIAFGAGPVSNLMTPEGNPDRQRQTLQAALECGINWFDTAATYGAGASESALGEFLADVDPGTPFHIATKVRIPPEQIDHVYDYVMQSVEESLHRLRSPQVTLLQLHNSVTTRRGEEPTSLSLEDVLGPQGVCDAFRVLKQQGKIAYCGLTGLGTPSILKRLLDSGMFDTIQAPFHLLNPSAVRGVPPHFAQVVQDKDLEQVLWHAHERGVGTFAIRVLAGGALAGHPASPHTLKTPFFPLALYQRDTARGTRLSEFLPEGVTLPEMAVRYAASHPAIDAVILGFSSPEQVQQAAGWGNLPRLTAVERAEWETRVMEGITV